MARLTLTDIEALPKIELHVHLDCSLSYAAAHAIMPTLSADEYSARFLAPQRCDGLLDYFRYLGPAIALLQTREALRIATLDLLAQLDADNVVYAEIRFAPQVHTQGDCAIDDVVAVVADAIAEGRDRYKVTARLLLCMLRPDDEAMARHLVALAGSTPAVAGIDLAGDELGYPVDAFISPFAAARDAGLGVTAHAGEAGGAGNVAEAVLQLGSGRIGHGVHAIEDEAVVDLLCERGVHLEVCPSCNVQIGLYPSLDVHPVERLVAAGVSVGINTDARGVTALSLSEQYMRLHHAFGWSPAHFAARNRDALNHAFVTPAERKRLEPLFSLQPE